MRGVTRGYPCPGALGRTPFLQSFKKNHKLQKSEKLLIGWG